ncbi:MAG: Na-translocating system protein MpsB, partial [Myxococcales bacterium]
MNSQLAENASLGEVTDPVAETPKPKVFRGGALGLDPPHIEDALARARAKIAPLWPLKSFVAVNPFLGLCDDRFEHACTTMRHVGGADMLMPRNYYRTLIAEGRIRDEDLESSLRTAPSGPGIPANLEELRCAI